jgi:hypothetical protein
LNLHIGKIQNITTFSYQASIRNSSECLRAVGPESYEDFMLVKSAYDILLRKKGFDNPDVAKVLTESNEYINIDDFFITCDRVRYCLKNQLLFIENTLSFL